MNREKRYDAILFDFDGVLAETERTARGVLAKQ